MHAILDTHISAMWAVWAVWDSELVGFVSLLVNERKEGL